MNAAPPDPYARLRSQASRGAKLTTRAIFVSALLGTVKVLGGLLGNSYALLADGVESLLDILSSLAVWGSFKVAASPPNERHPYGYGKVEPLAALVVAIVLCVAALSLALQSVREIRTPHHMPAPFTLAILVGVVAAKEVMFRRLSRAGDELGSRALRTEGWHHRSDAITSAAAFVGISAALLAGPGYESADDYAALLACGVIAYNGVRLFRGAWREILDIAPSPETIGRIRAAAAAVRQVLEIEKCRVRRSGLGLFCEIHVIVDGSMTVADGHRVAHEVKDALLSTDLGILDVLVHIEPESSRRPPPP